MGQEAIPFGPVQETGWLDVAGAGGVAFNVAVDGRGALRRRPGVGAFAGATSDVVDEDGISGIHVTDAGAIYAVGDSAVPRHIYRVTAGGFTDLSPADSTDRLAGTGRPVMAETEALLVLAGGAALQKVVLATEESSNVGDSPPAATHVAVNSVRLLANDVVIDKTKVRYSDQSLGVADFSGHETWSVGVGTAGFFTAEAKSDPVQAVYENTNEVFVFGTQNVQVYVPDPQLVFAPAATREYGLAAPYSVIRTDQSFAWLDHARRCVVSDGREFKIISEPLQSVLDGLPDVSDAFGYRVLIDWLDALVWTFPSAGLTLVYQQGVGWSQWAGRAGGNWSRFIVNAHHLKRGTAENVVGTTTGKVASLASAHADDDGTTIVADVTSGFLDRGTDNRKLCRKVTIAMKRGHGTSSDVVHLQWRDDRGAWNPPVSVHVGSSGDSDPVVPLYSLGVYRRRQWRLRFSGSAELGIARVTEDFEVLEN